MEVRGQPHARPLYSPDKTSRCPFYRMPHGPQSWSGRFGEKESQEAQGNSVIMGPEFVFLGLDYWVCNSKGVRWKVNRA
jgi:hypothetical protein